MARQSREDRIKRLSVGRCPIHGTRLVQLGPDEFEYCPRSDCLVRVVVTRNSDNSFEFRVVGGLDEMLTAFQPAGEFRKKERKDW